MRRKDSSNSVRLLTLRRETPPERIGYRILRWGQAGILLWACLLCTIFSYIDIFPTQQRPDVGILMLGSACIALWYTLVYSKSRLMRVLLPITLFVLIFLVWKERLWIWNAIQNLVDGVVVQINAYHGYEYSLWNARDIWITGFFLLAAGIVGIWCGFYTVRHPSPVLSLFPVILISVGGLYVGRFAAWYLWLLFIFCFFALRSLKKVKYGVDQGSRTGMMGAFALGAGAAACLLVAQWILPPLLQPTITVYQQELRQYQEEVIERIRSGEAIENTPIEDILSQFRRENLSLNNDPLAFTGRRILEVHLNQAPVGTLYLRGFVGGAYEQNEWRGSDTSDYEEQWHDQSIAIQNLGYETLNGQARSYEITIRTIGTMEDYAYIPYRVLLPQGAEPYGDGTIAQMEEDTVSYTGYPFVNLESRFVYMPQEASELQRAYSAYVHQVYTVLPETGLERLKQECAETGLYGAEDLDEITMYIAERLNELTYTRRPGALPAGADFTEYFLYEQQEGYCVHFATAATLMYRAMGIPARYVSGYAIPAENFNNINDAYALDSMGHAWVEVYDEDLGFIPVEVTPASAENPLYASEESEAEESREDSSVEESLSEEESSTPTNSTSREESSRASGWTQNSGTSHGVGEASVDIGPVLGILGGTLVVLALIGLPIYRLRYLRERRKHPPVQEDYREEIRKLGRNLFETLRYTGYRYPDQELTDREYMDQVGTEIAVEELSDLWSLIERAFYDGESMTEEEYRWALDIYEDVMAELSSEWKWWKKIWIVWIRGWK